MDCFRSRTKHSAKRSRLNISFLPFLVSFNLSTSSFVLDLGVKLRDPGCDNVQSVSIIVSISASEESGFFLIHLPGVSILFCIRLLLLRSAAFLSCSSSIFLFAFFIEDLYRLLMYFPFPVNLGSIDVRTLRSLDAVLVDADGPSFGELTTTICQFFTLIMFFESLLAILLSF